MNAKPTLVCALATIPIVGLMASQRSATQDTAAGGAVRHAAVDYDHDGRVDFFTVDPSGHGRLLVRLTDGTFEDRTESAGLGAVGAVDKAFFKDLANDRWADLVVLRPDGRLGLFSGFEGGFVDRSEALTALGISGVSAVEFDDYDLNGWFDLGLWLADGGTTILHNLGDLRFERRPGDTSGILGVPPVPGRLGIAAAPGSGAGSSTPAGPGICADQIMDQATGSCLDASSVPALGRLYPLSSDLFVANASGFVGINTTAPTSQLDVDGTLRVRSSGGISLDSGSFGIVFPDGSVQSTATVAGQPGPQGDPGPEGPAGTTLPVGTILMSGAAAAPPGFLLCDGSFFDENLYPQLAAAIGMSYGGGTAYRVPDLTQRFPMGADSTPGVTLGESGGSLSHTHVVPGHRHGVGTLASGMSGSHAHDISGLTVTGNGAHSHGLTGSIAEDGLHTHPFAAHQVGNYVNDPNNPPSGIIGSVQGGTAANVQPPGPLTENGGLHTHGHTLSITGTGTHSHDVGGTVATAPNHSHSHSGLIGNTSGPSGDAALASGQNVAASNVDRNPPFVTVHYIIKT